MQKRRQPPRILEFDEAQHFNRYRAATLRRYPRTVKLAFPKQVWIERALAKERPEGGAFGAAKPLSSPAKAAAIASVPSVTRSQDSASAALAAEPFRSSGLPISRKCRHKARRD